MTIKGLAIGGDNPVRVMGVINLSPESFYQRSVFGDEESLRNCVRTMESQGATIIDIGGASTAPSGVYGTTKVEEEKELERVSFAMGIIRKETSLPISIDTTSSTVAEIALDMGADIVNDVSGLKGDSEMAKLIAERAIPVVLMSNCPDGCSSANASYASLEESIAIAKRNRIELEKVILDPGIGFGKPPEVDFDILRRLTRFHIFGRPILVGVSRKAFIGALLGEPNPEKRLTGTVAVTSIAVMKGVDVIRAHDVAEACIASKVGEALSVNTVYDGQIEVLALSDRHEVELLLEKIGVGGEIRHELSQKGVMNQIVLRGLSAPAALIIKQEMLALGGDAAYHYDTIDHAIEKTDMLIMGTDRQIRGLVGKIKMMTYFGLSDIGKRIEKII